MMFSTTVQNSDSKPRQPLRQLLQCIAILTALPVSLPTLLTHPELFVQFLDVLWNITDVSN